MKQKIIKPKNDIAYLNTLNNLTSNTDKEQFMIFIHYLIIQNIKENKKITTYGVEVSTKFLIKKIFNTKTKNRILNSAQNQYSILINNSYMVQEYCKKYIVLYNNDYNIQTFDYQFTNKTNIAKFNNLFGVSINQYSSNFEYINNSNQLDFINKLSINQDKLRDTIFELNKKYTDNEDKLNYLKYLEYECFNFENLKDYSLYDTFAERYYNFFTNKPTVIRKCFTINGLELKNLDIKSSQIYFLTQLPKLNLSDYQVDKSKIIIENEFKEIVLNQDIYQYIADKLKVKRDKAKTNLLSYLYGDNRYTKIKKILQNDFPNTFSTIEYLKKIKPDCERFIKYKIRNDEEYTKSTYFNFILQNIEKKVFLNSILNLTDYFTIHDSAYFQEGREDLFQKTILNYFEKTGLDRPNLCLE